MEDKLNELGFVNEGDNLSRYWFNWEVNPEIAIKHVEDWEKYTSYPYDSYLAISSCVFTITDDVLTYAQALAKGYDVVVLEANRELVSKMYRDYMKDHPSDYWETRDRYKYTKAIPYFIQEAFLEEAEIDMDRVLGMRVTSNKMVLMLAS